jgi:hypothetical protein
VLQGTGVSQLGAARASLSPRLHARLREPRSAHDALPSVNDWCEIAASLACVALLERLNRSGELLLGVFAQRFLVGNRFLDVRVLSLHEAQE